MKTNGEASKRHTGGLVSCCLQSLWERQAGTFIQKNASQSGAGVVRISWEEEVLFPDYFLSPFGSCDITESIRQRFRQLEEMSLLTLKEFHTYQSM